MTILALKHAALQQCLWSWLETAASDKQGAVPSFIIILTHVLVLAKPGQTLQTFLETGLQEISPWCMAQNFYTRVVAQVCFRKLWSRCQEFSALVTKFQPLFDCISKSVNPNNADKITEDFYLTVFDPLACFNVMDIFHHFPRLCDISTDEIIQEKLLKTIPAHHIPLETSVSKLKSCQKKQSSQSAKLEEKTEGSKGSNIQKKITPWTSMMTDADIGLQGRNSEKHKRVHEDLIVVASLIDKSPNLGGLCRTCEILGVGSMVIHSKSIIKDKEFSAVSVTAENWLPLVECQPHKLSTFLEDKRKEGFTIVAVEQTSDSVSLQNYKFPTKCVFLLGKEKEGVPVELLNLVDVCVEIPQHGLIRSFNVHVTGALVVWEYVKQHIV